MSVHSCFELNEPVKCPCCKKQIGLNVQGDIKQKIVMYEVTPGIEDDPRYREFTLMYMDNVQIWLTPGLLGHMDTDRDSINAIRDQLKFEKSIKK